MVLGKHSCLTTSFYNMRSFSIVALCLVAACASAANIDDIRSCVRDRLRTKVEDLREDIDGRLKSIAESGNEAAAKAREELKVKTEEFQKALTEPLDQARSEYEQCVQDASGFFARARCVVDTGRALITKVIPIASEKTSELGEAINNIAVQFRDDNQGNFQDLGEQGRQFAKDALKIVRDCATQ